MLRRAVVLLMIALTVGGCSRDMNGVPRGFACPAFVVNSGWAVKLSETGSSEWRTRLASPAQPVVADGIAVAATRYSSSVYGLRLADGRLLWTWSNAQEVFGRWLWQGTLVVETGTEGQVTLTGLDALTGKVRWSTGLGTDLIASELGTGDGGLAFLTADDVLETIDFSSGRIRWSVATGVPPNMEPAVAAGDGMVVFFANGGATGYDARTGRVRWSSAGLAFAGTGWFADGLLLVTSSLAGGSAVLTALSPGTGQVAWRFSVPVNLPGLAGGHGGLGPLGLIGSGPAGLLVGDENPARLYLLNPATGQPRWGQDAALPGIAASFFVTPEGDRPPGSAASIVTPTDVVSSEGSGKTTRIVDRDAADGRVRWPAPTAESMAATGSLVVAEDAPGGIGGSSSARLRAYRLSTGQLAWQATLPGSVPADLTSVPGGVLAEVGVPSPPSC
jgi:outer membrane protein assembly factor BamB